MKNQIRAIGRHGVNNLELIQVNTYACDVHHELYNMDYFIIGTYQAKQFLNKYGVFEAIDKVTEYEKNQFGEITTNIAQPKKLVNMLAYVIGEELLLDCPTIQNKWNDRLTAVDIRRVKRELKKAVINYISAI